ncbi:MAG: pantoate--beta-alanine ligase [Planctomycetes bacterium]|nr:pantoate--beta-alanine ligase [Planctomycetota bacterium]
MQRFGEPQAAARWCAEQRAQGRTLGFVPTMGALHEGHLALVRRARAENDVVCVSIFVNPLQFDEKSDFERYPRDFEADAGALDAAGAQMAFTGTLAGFFSRELRADGSFDPAFLEDPGAPAQGLEGALRPGHFAGVATIVRRLFETVRPARAYFGQKDFQQTLVVRELARRLGAPPIVVCPTTRERDGLALSSRNVFLSAEERARAVAIPRALEAARARFAAGERRASELARVLRDSLAGFALDYATVRDPECWTGEEPQGELERAVALVALRLGAVRLIDNRALHTQDGAL